MVGYRRSRRRDALARLKVEPGRYFSVPLFGGGFAYGYITFFDRALMALCDIHDFMGDAPGVPHDIEELPIILRDLRLSTTEFTLSDDQFSAYGPRWMLSRRVRSAAACPGNRLFLMGPRDARVVTDISDVIRIGRPPPMTSPRFSHSVSTSRRRRRKPSKSPFVV